jgi:hypothetical protein
MSQLFSRKGPSGHGGVAAVRTGRGQRAWRSRAAAASIGSLQPPVSLASYRRRGARAAGALRRIAIGPTHLGGLGRSPVGIRVRWLDQTVGR